MVNSQPIFDPEFEFRGTLKQYEQELVNFFERISEFLRYEPKITKIFAYIQIYGNITQEKLQKLSGYSRSTVSTTLKSLIEIGAIHKRFIPGTHQYIYFLATDEIAFTYQPNTGLMTSTESLSIGVEKLLIVVKNDQKNSPEYTEFLILRLNSILNYCEAQRRAIKGQQVKLYYPERVRPSVYFKISQNLPLVISPIEERLIDLIMQTHIITSSKLIDVIIFVLFITRGKLTQRQLQTLTNSSGSNISRKLQWYLTCNFYSSSVSKSEHGLIFYELKSFSLAMLSLILQSDKIIFEFRPRLREIFDSLDQCVDCRKPEITRFKAIVQDILNAIEAFAPSSLRLQREISEIHTTFYSD